MSSLNLKALQVGQSLSAANNFTLYQPNTPDGTIRLGRGNIGAVTDLLTVSNTGTLSANNLTYAGTLTGDSGILNIGTNQIYKDVSGNVGIGTNTPSTKLHVYSSTDPSIMVETPGSSNQASLNLYNNTRKFRLIADGSQNSLVVYDQTAGAERLRVDSSQIKSSLAFNPDGGMYAPISGALGGSYAAGTWYTVTNSSALTRFGIYVIEYLASTHSAGGALYDWYACTVPFAWNPTNPNSGNSFTFPALMGSGHADNGQSQSISFRLRQTYAASDGKSYIEFSTSVALSGLNGTAGKNVIISVKRLA